MVAPRNPNQDKDLIVLGTVQVDSMREPLNIQHRQKGREKGSGVSILQMGNCSQEIKASTKRHPLTLVYEGQIDLPSQAPGKSVTALRTEPNCL